MASGWLITCDLVCLGVPSPGVFHKYIEWLQADSGKSVAGYVHRGHGEPWGRYEEQIVYSDGSTEAGTTRSKVWQRIWSRYLLRPSCYSCGYHSVSRPGNLTIGDYWGVESVHSGIADQSGVCCLMVNDLDGMDILEGISERVELVQSSVGNCANVQQPALRVSPKKSELRDGFMRTVFEEGFSAACVAADVLGVRRAAKDAVKKMVGRFGAPEKKVPSAVTSGAWESVGIEEADRALFPQAYVARNKSRDIRVKSSSGGLFYALAEYIVEQEGVVYGCAFDDELVARHVRCETLQQCERCMGSKYSQSNMGRTISEIKNDLSSGRLVLFCGTPCQVDAVRKACEPGGGRYAQSRRIGKSGECGECRIDLPELYVSREECCGCTACVFACSVGAIAMRPDEEGFDYPVVDAERCVGCGRCLSACAFKEAKPRDA